jgi:hypothetical protein
MKTQRLLAKDLFTDIGPMIGDSGVCTDTPEGVAQFLRFLNLACFNLHKRLDSEGTLFEWYSDVQQGCFALPQECREARQLGINGAPLRQRSEFYIGKVATGANWEGCCGPWECRDLGDFYIPQYLPKKRGIRIALVALDANDSGREVVVEVTNEYGETKRETLVLKANGDPSIMESVAYDVTFFKKPKTQGTVALQLHYDDGQRFNFCQYHADTEEGLFRRKQLPTQFWGCNIIRILGKCRYVQITDPDQVIPYNDATAVGFACAAQASWRQRDLASYQQLMQAALDELKAQMQDADSASNVKQIHIAAGVSNPSMRWQSAGYYGNGFNRGYGF